MNRSFKKKDMKALPATMNRNMEIENTDINERGGFVLNWDGHRERDRVDCDDDTAIDY